MTSGAICPQEPDMDDCKTKKKRCLRGPCSGNAYTKDEECPSGYNFNPETCQCEPQGLFYAFAVAYYCPGYSDGRFDGGGARYCPGSCFSSPESGIPTNRGGPVVGCNAPEPIYTSYGDFPGGFPSCGLWGYTARSEIYCETEGGDLVRFSYGGTCGSCRPKQMISCAWYLVPEDNLVPPDVKDPFAVAEAGDSGQPALPPDIDPGPPWE